MNKYRVRLHNGRVIGPFEKNQLFELKTMGHIKGNEEAQIYPTGNWEDISKFDFYSDLMDENRTIVQKDDAPIKEETFFIDLAKIRYQQQEKEIEEYDQGTVAPIEKLSETIRIENDVPTAEAPEEERSGPVLSNFEDFMQLIEENNNKSFQNIELNTHEKTIINPIAQKEIEKIKKQKIEEEQKLKEQEERKLIVEEKIEKQPEISSDMATQVFKLDGINLIEEAKKNELEIIKDLQKKVIQNNHLEIGALSEKEEEKGDEAFKQKRKKIIIIAVALISFAILFPDDGREGPKFKSIKPEIVFPTPYDYSDLQRSESEYQSALKLVSSGKYPDLVKAGIKLKNSFENNVENFRALNLLVRTYAEQLNYSKNKLHDAQVLFNIIQSKKPFLIQDPDGVIGLNLFYVSIGKIGAANDVVAKYLKLNPKNVTEDLFAVYIMSLIKQGNLDKAKDFYIALNKSENKTKLAYIAIIEYLLLNNDYEKASQIVEEGLKKFPKISQFHLISAELYFKNRKIDLTMKSLKNSEKLGFDSNNIDRAKYYEILGLVYAFKNKPNEASMFLKRSLKLNDSNELRIKLAELVTSDKNLEETNKMINESKAIKYLIEAKDFYKLKNYELALSSAAKSTDAYPGHIESELFLSKVQLKLGLTSQGLATIEEIAKKFPEDTKINISLIEAYIETFKFLDAKKRIQLLSTTPLSNAWEYSSVNAKYFYKLGDSLQSMSWLKRSIGLNPLNDEDIFLFSQLLFKKANFENAKQLLLKCIELDPVNPDYRIAYARLLYEIQDDLAAIGYLLNLKEDFGDDPKILSEIAIFYYRSGKIKDFQDYKNKLEKDHSTQKAFYDFLIKAAMLDDRNTDIPPLVQKIISIEPSDYESMMIAGKVMFESGKIIEAAKWFKKIKEKLPTYPKVLYYMAKIDFLSGDLDGALKKIEEDIVANGETDDDLVFMGQIFLSKGKLIEAENLFKKAQKINPKSYDAIIGLADLSTSRSNHDLALDLYKRALKIREDEPFVHKKIGDVYRQLGQGSLAIESYKLYLDMVPDSPFKSNLEAYINLMK